MSVAHFTAERLTRELEAGFKRALEGAEGMPGEEVLTQTCLGIAEFVIACLPPLAAWVHTPEALFRELVQAWGHKLIGALCAPWPPSDWIPDPEGEA